MLHQQSGAINEQAASATVDLAKLQAAFDNIYATMDEIDTFKVAALDTMQKTVTALTTEIDQVAVLPRSGAGRTRRAAPASIRSIRHDPGDPPALAPWRSVVVAILGHLDHDGPTWRGGC